MVFKKNAVVKGQLLRVENNAKIQNNLRVNNNIRVDNILRVDGLTKLNGNVKMPNISLISSVSNPNLELLTKNENGQIKAMTKAQLVDMLYDNYDCLSDPNGNPVLLPVNSPIWNNGVNKIFYHYPCSNEPVKVGIGTSNSQFKLHVKGITYTQKIKVGKLNVTDQSLISGFTGQSNVNLKNSSNNNVFSIDQTGLMLIKNQSGHIFTAYASDNTKVLQLEDDGLLRARKIKVDEANWADYVFKSEYNLLPLSELEKFIFKNKHLPNIPTAQTIKSEGLDLSNMQRLQMEKIEELTIYTIEQDKKIKDLQKQIDEIKELLKNK